MCLQTKSSRLIASRYSRRAPSDAMSRTQHLLQLKQEFPNSTVKLRESYEKVRKRHCVPISVRRRRFRSRNEIAALHRSSSAPRRAYHDWTRIEGAL